MVLDIGLGDERRLSVGLSTDLVRYPVGPGCHFSLACSTGGPDAAARRASFGRTCLLDPGLRVRSLPSELGEPSAYVYATVRHGCSRLAIES